MLTIKIRRPDGSEWVEEVSSVSLNTLKQSPTGRPSVSMFRHGKEPLCMDIFEGMVYVMNENGSTVANYDLGCPPVRWPETSEPDPSSE